MKNLQYKGARARRLARHDFPIVMSTGKRATCDYFSIIYTDKVSGYAIVVSKKIAKKAVTRHRIKRRVRSVLRNSKIAGRGCIIFARPGADKITFQDLNLEIQELLARVR